MQTRGSSSELPAVDERLVAPETRHEIEDGRVVYVPPADEPHGSTNSNLASVLTAHRDPSYLVAVDMLTRTSRVDDIAPDVSVYPAARHPQTGGRQLEERAFEIVSTGSLGHAAARAVKLIERGVRRVFAIDVERGRALEWSPRLDAWSILDHHSHIEDLALAVPLPVSAMLDAAQVDASVARALRIKRHPEFLAEREEGVLEGEARGLARGRAEARAEGRVEGRAESVVLVLEARGLQPSHDERVRILGERDPVRLGRWLAFAATCSSVAELLAT